MKKIFLWIKEKTVIMLNHIIGLLLFISLFEEYNNFVILIMFSFIIISFTLSKYMSKVLEKYELKTKIWHYIGTIALNILSIIIYVLVYRLFDFSSTYYITDTISDYSAVSIYTLIYISSMVFVNFMYWIVLIYRKVKKTNKKEVIKKMIKYAISISLLSIYMFLMINIAYIGIYNSNIMEFLIGVYFLHGLLHLSLAISPLFDFICKKINKSFNVVAKTLYTIIPILVLTSMFIILYSLSQYLVYIEYKIVNIIVIIIIMLYIILNILFFVLNKKKHDKTSKTKVYKVVLTIILSIITTIIFTVTISKSILIYNINKIAILFEKKTIKIDNKEFDSEEYLDLDWLKIRNDFKDFKTSNNQGVYRLYTGDKAIIFEAPLDITSKNSFYYGISYDFVAKIYEINGINNNYDLANYIFNNSKTKLNIFDSFSTIFATASLNGNTYKIEYEDYVAFINNWGNKLYIMNLYDLENNNLYHISFKDYTEDEIYDLIGTIKINETYELIEEYPKIYTSENIFLHHGIDYIEEFYEGLNAKIDCNDDMCDSALLVIGDNSYTLNQYDILYNTNFMMLVNKFEGYNILQIFDKNGLEVINIRYENMIKIGDSYKLYDLRYKDGKFYYYEKENEEYIHKTIDTNNNFIIENVIEN